MPIPKIEIKTIKTVNLSDVCRDISKFTGDTQSGRRVWNYISESFYGNQLFCNDTYFVFLFPDIVQISNEYLRVEIGILEEMCKEAIDYDDSDYGTLIFNVCW